MRYLIFIALTTLFAACRPGPGTWGNSPSSVAKRWGVKLKYINPDTKELIIGKDRWFPAASIKIIEFVDSSYRYTCTYNDPTCVRYFEDISEKDSTCYIVLAKEASISTDEPDIEGKVKEERFLRKYVISMWREKQVLRDTLMLIKDSDDTYRLEDGKGIVAELPNQQSYKDIPVIELER